jgi:hypothetical protein
LPEFKIAIFKGARSLAFDVILDETSEKNVFDLRIESFYHPSSEPHVKDEPTYKLRMKDATAVSLLASKALCLGDAREACTLLARPRYQQKVLQSADYVLNLLRAPLLR